MNSDTSIKLAVGTHGIPITFFKDEFASSLRTDVLTLAELRDLILRAKAASKGKLRWLKLAQFGKLRAIKNDGTPGSCLRYDGNVTGFSGLELDYDGEAVGFDEAIVKLKELHARFLIYTSPSHTAAKPRWRILMPVSRFDLPLEMRGKLCARVNGALGNIFARETFALSQSYYYGHALDNLAPDHRAEVVDGRLVDLCDDLYKYEKRGMPPPPSSANLDQGKADVDNQPSQHSPIDWTKVAEYFGWLKCVADLPADFSAKGKLIVGHTGSLEDLRFDLDQAKLASKPYKSWSEVSFALAAIFKNDQRYSNEQIAAALLSDLTCNQHVIKQRDQRRAVERLIGRCYQQPDANVRKARPAGEPDWRERRIDGSPLPSMHNARLAICTLGIECRYDTFHGKLLFGYRGDATQHTIEKLLGEVSDNGIIALRQLMSDRFGFDLTDQYVRDAVTSLALEHCFDPVVDMLSSAEAGWDGEERLDRMAADYLNCEDTTLNAAMIRKTMIAAVARARNPGIKFDQITVLESSEGFNKSTAWRVLAGDDSFSDESIIGKNSREVQEQLSEVWVHENADLAGMRKAEVETIKAYASRMIDIARPAYGHFVRKQKRHSIEVGTTNSSEYLQSQTGNRRFWSLRVLTAISIEKMQRDRLQLWGEAAYYQSKGEALVLDEALWGSAGVEQEMRRVTDPWENVLRAMPEYVTINVREVGKDGFQAHKELDITIIHQFTDFDQERVSASDLLEHVLKLSPGNQRVEHSMRLSNVMRQLGWQRANNGYVTISHDRRVKGYYRSKPKPGSLA